MEKRITKAQLYMQVAYLTSLRSKCKRLKVGCIIVRNKRIISSGCNGPVDSNTSEYCECIEKEAKCGEHESVHAEMNAVAFAARHGLELEGSTIYITHSPCFSCSKLLLQTGIRDIIYWKEYRDTLPIKYLNTHDIKISKFSGNLQEYPDTDL